MARKKTSKSRASISWAKALLVAMAAFAIVLYGCGRRETPATPAATETPSLPPIQVPVETLIDDTVRQLLQDASTEQEDVQREAAAAALAAEDDAALRAIAQEAELSLPEVLPPEDAIDLLLEELLADAATMQQQILGEEAEAALLSPEDASLRDIGGLADENQLQ